MRVLGHKNSQQSQIFALCLKVSDLEALLPSQMAYVQGNAPDYEILEEVFVTITLYGSRLFNSRYNIVTALRLPYLMARRQEIAIFLDIPCQIYVAALFTP